MNCYATVDRLKRFLQITTTDRDSDILFCLESASRAIDLYCNRHFYVETATRYYDGPGDSRHLWIDDCLSISALATDTDDDGTFDDESWTEGTDYRLWPDNGYPKRRIDTLTDGNYVHNDIARGYQIVGEWGYGDGTSSPVEASSVTGTVASTTGTSLTISVSGGLEAGQTIMIGSERMFVSSVTTTTATVERGVNGSTAATHSTAAISTYCYPIGVSKMALWAASQYMKEIQHAGIAMQSVAGELQFTFSNQINIESVWTRTLGKYRRIAAQVR